MVAFDNFLINERWWWWWWHPLPHPPPMYSIYRRTCLSLSECPARRQHSMLMFPSFRVPFCPLSHLYTVLQTLLCTRWTRKWRKQVVSGLVVKIFLMFFCFHFSIKTCFKRFIVKCSKHFCSLCRILLRYRVTYYLQSVVAMLFQESVLEPSLCYSVAAGYTTDVEHVFLLKYKNMFLCF